MNLIPLKNKRVYIPFEEIIEIEIKKYNNKPYIIYIHVKDKRLYELDKFDVIELHDAIDLIFNAKEKKMIT